MRFAGPRWTLYLNDIAPFERMQRKVVVERGNLSLSRRTRCITFVNVSNTRLSRKLTVRSEVIQELRARVGLF